MIDYAILFAATLAMGLVMMFTNLKLSGGLAKVLTYILMWVSYLGAAFFLAHMVVEGLTT